MAETAFALAAMLVFGLNRWHRAYLAALHPLHPDRLSAEQSAWGNDA